MIRTGQVALCAALGLAGCSPGGGDGGSAGGGAAGNLAGFVPSGDIAPGDPSFVPGTLASADLLLLAFEGDGTMRDGTGGVNLASGAVTGALLAGQIDGARTRIDLAGDGSIDLSNPAGTEYVRQAAATTGAVPFFGVLGIPSLPSDLPVSGRVSYSGRTVLVGVDSLSRYDLTGTALVGADFGTGRVLIELGDLGGTRQGVAGASVAPETVAATGRIVISDSVISGATFAGGRASSSGLPFLVATDTPASGTQGAFFGPGADEVGGRIGIPGTETQVIGSFVAE